MGGVRGPVAAAFDSGNGPRHSARRTAQRLAFLLPILSGAVLAAGPGADAAPTRSATALTRQLRAQGVSLSNERIEGDILLRGTVRYPLVCHDCDFTGDVDAEGAVISKMVDISGSVVEGKLNLAGARF